MQNHQIKRTAVATAVSAILAGGMVGAASAGDLSGLTVDIRPTRDGVPFVPDALMSFTGAYAGTQTGDVTVQVVLLNDADVPTGSASGVDAAGADDDRLQDSMNADLRFAQADPTGAAKAVVILTVTDAGDNFGGTDKAAFVSPDGSITPAADAAAAQLAAITAEAFFDVDPTYDRIGATAGFRSADTMPAEVFVQFNADPVKVSPDTNGQGTPWANPDLFSSATISMDTGGAIQEAGAPVDAEVSLLDGDVMTLTGVGAVDFPGSPDTVVTNSFFSPNLGDGAGNTVQNTTVPLDTLQPPNYADLGEAKAIATTGALTVDNAYGETGVGSVVVNVRMNQAIFDGPVPGDGSFQGDGFDDLNVRVGGLEFRVPDADERNAIALDADDIRSILRADLTAEQGGGERFFFNGETGNLMHGVTRDTAQDVEIQLIGHDTDGVALDFSPGTKLMTGQTTEFTTVRVGNAQEPMLSTKDADQDGFIDGGTVDFQQPTSAIVTTEISLVSFQDDGAMPAKFVDLMTTPSGADDTTIMLELVAKDTPDADGNPPASSSNDYDGNGTLDDFGFILPGNLATDLDSSLLPAPGVPWRVRIGEYDVDDVLMTTMEYVNVFEAQTGGPLGVTPQVIGYTKDGASPVLQRVEWQESGDVPGLGKVTLFFSEDIQARDGSDVDCAPPPIVIADAQNDTINEVRFTAPGTTNPRTPDLLNIEFEELNDIDIDPVLITINGVGMENQVMLFNVPDVVGHTTTLGSTGAVEDLVCLPAFVAPGKPDQDTVMASTPPPPSMTSIHAEQVSGKYDHVVVQFNRDIAQPDGQAPEDQTNLFTVRVNVGHNPDFINIDTEENPEAAEPNEVFQFLIDAGNVAFPGDTRHLGGDDAVTLILSDPLPGNTVNISVDYQGVSQDDAEAGNLRYVAAAPFDPLEPIAALNDDDKQFDDDEESELMMPIASRNVPIEFTFTGLNLNPDPDLVDPEVDGPFFDDPGEFGPTAEDEDTRSENFPEPLPPFIGLGEIEESGRDLVTQRVSGVISYNGDPIFAGTPVRADLVTMVVKEGEQRFERKALAGDGLIEVRQGNNSEFGDAGPATKNNQNDQSNWVIMALKNSALNSANFDTYARDKQRICDLTDTWESAVANNRDSRTIDRALASLRNAENTFDRNYEPNSMYDDGVDCSDEDGPTADRHIWGYVEVTHGDGGKAQNGSSSQGGEPLGGIPPGGAGGLNPNNALANGNASFGRTATLLRTVPNRQRNGTSYYPVMIDMETGEIDEAHRNDGGVNFTRNVRNGQLHLIQPILAKAGKDETFFKVTDTAYALVGEDGKYQVTVGMDRDSFDVRSNDLTSPLAFDGACILIKVRNTVRDSINAGLWTQVNSCESSFTSYRPFEGDLNRNGLPTVLDADLHNISIAWIFDDGDWELPGVAGTMARDASNPLVLEKFFIQADPDTGAPVTLWGMDGGWGDAVATLGLNEGREPAVQLAFELGDSNDNVTIGSINPKPGAALAFHGDGKANWWKAVNASTKDMVSGELVKGHMNNYYGDDRKLYVPVTPSTAATLAPDAWHLVTFAGGEDVEIADFIGPGSAYPQIDAAIIFHLPVIEEIDDEDILVIDNHSGRDDSGDMRLDGDVDTFTWFAGEDVPIAILQRAIGVFVHVNADGVSAFNVAP